MVSLQFFRVSLGILLYTFHMYKDDFNPEHLSLSKAAALCGVSRNTLLYWLRNENVSYEHVKEGRYVVRLADLRRFMAANGMIVPPKLIELTDSDAEAAIANPPRPLKSATSTNRRIKLIDSSSGRKPRTSTKMKRVSGGRVTCAVGADPLVIVVGQQLATLQITLRTLQKLEVNVLVAENGLEVQVLLRKHPETALIILNKTMPGLDGVQAYKRIREYNKTIPIILLSGPSADVKLLENDQLSRLLQGPARLGHLQRAVSDMLYL